MSAKRSGGLGTPVPVGSIKSIFFHDSGAVITDQDGKAYESDTDFNSASQALSQAEISFIPVISTANDGVKSGILNTAFANQAGTSTDGEAAVLTISGEDAGLTFYGIQNADKNTLVSPQDFEQMQAEL